MSVLIRLLDGPEAGNDIIARRDDEPPDRIIVFRTQYAADGVLVYAPEEKKLSGDHIYRKVSRSDLFDAPGFTSHPNVMAGCAYEFEETHA